MSVHAEPPPAIVSEPHGIHYATSNQLGKGGFAICYKAERLDKDKPTGHLVALKIVKTKMEPVKLAQKFVTELQIHSKLSHPNIVAFHRAFSFGESTYVVLELCSSGSLADMLKKRKSLTMPEIRRLIIQVSGAVKYLHARNIVHRDLKTGNLFLDEHMNIKVGDFGLAALLVSGKDMEAIRRTTMCGTPNYLAPEILAKGKGHNDKVDLWAIGIIAYTLAVGRAPFHAASKDEIYKKLKAGNYSWPELSSINNDISADLRDLVSSLLVPEELRPCPDQIVSHAFFRIAYVPRQMSRSQTQKPPTWPNAPLPTPEVLQRGYSDSWWHVCKETGVGEYMPGKCFQLNSGKRIRSVVREIEKEVAAGRQPTIPIAHDTVYTTFPYSGTWASQGSLNLDEIVEEKEPTVTVRQLKDISNNEVQLPPLPNSRDSSTESDDSKKKDAEMMPPPPAYARRPGTVRRTRNITAKPSEAEYMRPTTISQQQTSQPASDVASSLRPESAEGAVASKRSADASLARRPRTIRRALPDRDMASEGLTAKPQEVTQPTMAPPVRSIRSRAKPTPPEVIEIFDDAVEKQGNLVLPAPPVMKASLPKPRNNLGLAAAFPGTDPEAVLERLCRFRDNLVASVDNKRVAPSRRSLNQAPETLPFVSRWVDYSKKHGVGYILEDGTVGYIANASPLKGTPVTHIVVRDGERWLKRVQPKTLSNLDKVPFDILEDSGAAGIQRMAPPRTNRERERVHMLKVLWVKFGRYMCPGLEVCEDFDPAEDKASDAISGRPFVRYYQRLGSVGLWTLTDGCIQVHFPDHTKLVLSADGLHISATLVPAEGFTAIQQCNEVPMKILKGRETITHPIHALLYGSQPGRGQKSYAELVKANMVEQKLAFLLGVLEQWIGGGGLGCGSGRVQWEGPSVKEQARKTDWVTVGRYGGDIVNV